MAIPCNPADATAKKIADKCDAEFAGNKTDCNKFVKAALGPFLGAGYFDGLDADGIVGKLKKAGEGWTASRKISVAIAQAKAGKVVIAGMTSVDLGQQHGHLAVVVGCDGQLSDTIIVPLGYAGSIDAEDKRLSGGRLSGTFKAAWVREEKIDYYYK